MPDSFRFVLTYRCEQRKEAPPVWRGWVELVFPTDNSEDATHRRYFIHLKDSSDLIAKMIEDAGGPDASQL